MEQINKVAQEGCYHQLLANASILERDGERALRLEVDESVKVSKQVAMCWAKDNIFTTGDLG